MPSFKMDREFFIPTRPDQLKVDSRDGKYFIEDEVNVDHFSEAERVEMIEEVHSFLAKKGADKIYLNGDNFNRLFSLVGTAASDEPSVRIALTQCLCSNLTSLQSTIDNTVKTAGEDNVDPDIARTLRSAVRMYVYLLKALLPQIQLPKDPAAPAEKKKASKSKKKTIGEDQEEDGLSLRKSIVHALKCVLDIPFSRLWRMGKPETEFTSSFLQVGMMILESQPETKNSEMLGWAFHLVILSCRNFAHYLATNEALKQLIRRHEHVANIAADLVGSMVQDHNDSTILTDILTDIAAIDFQDDSKEKEMAKNYANFMTRLGRVIPQTLLSKLPCFVTLIECNSYVMRNAIVEMVGSILHTGFAGLLDDSYQSQEAMKKMTETRAILLDSIKRRTLDTNSFTRSSVLKTLGELATNNSLPVREFSEVAQLGLDRIHDKKSNVRNSAISMLTMLLCNNPFAGSLEPKVFEEKREEVMAEIQATGKILLSKTQQETVEEDEEEKIEDSNEIIQLRQREKEAKNVLTFTDQALLFISTMDKAGEVIANHIMGSAYINEVHTAIGFFVSATQFSLPCHKVGIKNMLPLVFSNNEKTPGHVLNAYSELFINVDDSAEVHQNASVAPLISAERLIRVVRTANLSEQTCLEEVFRLMITSDMISTDIIGALWDIFAGRVSRMRSISYRRGSLIILGIFIGAGIKVTKENLETLVNIGFKKAVGEDSVLRYTCAALSKLPNKVKDPKNGFELDDSAWQSMAFALMGESIAKDEWYTTAEESIKAVYSLHKRPDMFCGTLVKAMATKLFFSEGESQPATSVKSLALSKFVYIIGCVATRHLVFVESLSSHVQRAFHKRQMEANEKKSKDKTGIEAELGVDEAQGAEELEVLQEICDHDIVNDNLLGQFAPLLVKLCTPGGEPLEKSLYLSAVHSLCKLMTVSPRFCEENLRVLFSILKHSNIPDVRANIIVVIGDLSIRHPNLLEPWSDHVYSRLRDEDSRVRKHTVMILTHLVLNGMIKVKGHVSELLLCMNDTDERIAALARTFFSEYSKRGAASGTNPIYNIMPDTISKLSADETVTPEAFREYMTFIMKFIDKDKHSEGLADKLSQRFSTTDDPKSWRDVAYCISQLKHTEKSLKKINDNFKHLTVALTDDDTYNFIMTAINKVKSKEKAEKSADGDVSSQSVVEELLLKIEEVRGITDAKTPEEGASGEATESQDVDKSVLKDSTNTRASAPKSKSKKSTPKKPVRKSRRKKAESSDEESDDAIETFDDVESSEDERVVAKKKAKPAATRGRGRRATVELDSD